MHKTIVAFLIIILSSACLLSPPVQGEEKKQTNNFVERQRIGMGLLLTNGKIVVRSIAPDLPAEKAGILTGDVVLAADGKTFANAAKMMDYVSSRKKGATIKFEVLRSDKKLIFGVEPVTAKMRPTFLKLNSLILDNQKVVLAIFVSDVKSTFDRKKEIYDSWAAGIRNEELTSMENFYLKYAGYSPNFSIVDRNRTQVLLDEFKLGQTGLISDTLRVKIGEMTGATHVLDVNFSQFKKTKGHDDVITARLIDITSGTVLAVDQMRISRE
jgi:membrane-associated protease RseP (regulator of RpoE activity)